MSENIKIILKSDEEWQNFKSEFNKSYSDEEEAQK